MALKNKIAQSCDISEKQAANELDCVVEDLHTAMEEGDELSYDEVEDAMLGLGVELDDDNFEELLLRLMY